MLSPDTHVLGLGPEKSLYDHPEFDRHKRAVKPRAIISDMENLAYSLIQCGETSSANALFMAVASLTRLQERYSPEDFDAMGLLRA